MDAMKMMLDWLQTHPKGMEIVVLILLLNMVMKAVVDSLVAVREEADKPMPAGSTKFDKFVRFMQLLALFISKIASYFVGFRTVR